MMCELKKSSLFRVETSFPTALVVLALKRETGAILLLGHKFIVSSYGHKFT